MLSDIRSELVTDHGINISTTGERVYVDNLINQALNEIYTNNELYLSEREQLFDIGSEYQIITLPHDVDKVLAVRRYTSRQRVKQEDMRPRYRSMSWAEPYIGHPYLAWRFKNRSCLKKEFLNVAPFTYTINQAIAAGFRITVTGRTNTASQVTEVITFGATDTAKTGTVAFTEYFSMQKSAVISQDVVVTDADGNEVSVIPNNVLRCSYPYYQVLDRNETYSTDNTLVEVLYKLKQSKLVNDTDIAMDEVYDKAIYYKASAMYYAKKPGEDSLNRALAYNEACEKLLKSINESYMRNSTSEIIYAPSVGSQVISAIRGGYDGRRL